jgi:GNAT superfamily N-acetyltransferase
VSNIYVLPDHRGKGIGTRLFKHLAEMAIERGCGRFEWWALDWNAPAIGFYESLGAKAMDEWMVFRITCDKLKKLVGKG